MFKSIKVADTAAFSMFTLTSLLAYGVMSAAGAHAQSVQAQPYQAPVIVAPAVATPVEPVVSDSAITPAPVASATVPMQDEPDTLAELVSTWQDDGNLTDEEKCLATAIFYESKSESLEGQLAVAHVVMARAESGRFADTLCGVVKQRGQFGFVRNGRLPDVPESSRQWQTAKAVAHVAMEGSWKNPVEGALFFHATYTSPDWGRPRVATIGRHVFYR